VKAIEDRLFYLEDKIESEFIKINTKILNVSRLQYYDTAILSQISFMVNTPRQKIDAFDSLVDLYKYRKEAIEELSKDPNVSVWTFDDDFIYYQTLRLAKSWNIKFEDICTYLFDRIDKNDLRNEMKKESILKIYGNKALALWDTLF